MKSNHLQNKDFKFDNFNFKRYFNGGTQYQNQASSDSQEQEWANPYLMITGFRVSTDLEHDFSRDSNL